LMLVVQPVIPLLVPSQATTVSAAVPCFGKPVDL